MAPERIGGDTINALKIILWSQRDRKYFNANEGHMHAKHANMPRLNELFEIVTNWPSSGLIRARPDFWDRPREYADAG